ncbi:Uncharacterised protein [Bordetella pertussis]|nr:Uncharacterised protein [Bordetella pertussis]
MPAAGSAARTASSILLMTSRRLPRAASTARYSTW